MQRKFSPYEKTHLKRFGQNKAQRNLEIDDFGEMPVEYITERVEFMDWVFVVNEKVMIPRIESEELVELALKKIKRMDRQRVRVADVGCGSGALGLSLFLSLEKLGFEVELVLSDVSVKALAVAEENVGRLIKEGEQIKIIESDLLTAYPTEMKLDIIIANLPYIPASRVKILEKSVKEYEPHLALDGGETASIILSHFCNKRLKNCTKTAKFC